MVGASELITDHLADTETGTAMRAAIENCAELAGVASPYGKALPEQMHTADGARRYLARPRYRLPGPRQDRKDLGIFGG